MKLLFTSALFLIASLCVSAQTGKQPDTKPQTENAKPKFNEFFTSQMENAVESILKQLTVDEKLKM